MNFDKIVCFPSIDWFHNWERQQVLIYMLAEHYSDKEVIVFEPLGLINHSLKSICQKVKDRLGNRKSATESYSKKILKNMSFANLNFIPLHYIKPIDAINFTLLSRKVEVKEALVWATYVNGFTLKAFKAAKYRVLDLATRRQVSPFLSNSVKNNEIEAVKIADVVFVDNYNTYLDYRDYAKKIIYLPQGVDIQVFNSDSKSEEYIERINSGRKLVGYCGTLHEFIDYTSLINVIHRMPEVDFMFVGNIADEQARKLEGIPNVILTGRKDHKDLGKYYNLFDVGLIPYKLVPHTSGVFPTKFFEYLICGVPVISTALPDLVNYGKLDFLKIYSSDDELISAINSFLEHSSLNQEAMISFASDNSWESRFQVIKAELNKF